MKRFVLAAVAAVSLAGCLSFPTTPEELRSHSGVRTETIEVNRSAAAVLRTLTNKGRECMTFNSRTQMVSMTMNAIFTDSYRTKREGNSFIVEHFSENNVGNPGWYPRVMADVVSTGSGARVTTYAPIGDGATTDVIQAWARGDTSECPVDDWF